MPVIGPAGPPGAAAVDVAPAKKQKTTRKEREAEMRAMDREIRGTAGIGIQYDKVSDKPIVDSQRARGVRSSMCCCGCLMVF